MHVLVTAVHIDVGLQMQREFWAQQNWPSSAATVGRGVGCNVSVIPLADMPPSYAPLPQELLTKNHCKKRMRHGTLAVWIQMFTSLNLSLLALLSKSIAVLTPALDRWLYHQNPPYKVQIPQNIQQIKPCRENKLRSGHEIRHCESDTKYLLIPHPPKMPYLCWANLREQVPVFQCKYPMGIREMIIKDVLVLQIHPLQLALPTWCTWL